MYPYGLLLVFLAGAVPAEEISYAHDGRIGRKDFFHAIFSRFFVTTLHMRNTGEHGHHRANSDSG